MQNRFYSFFLSEFLGTAFLLATIVGSGIMAENLAQGNAAIALLAISTSVGVGLFVLVQCLGEISGAHLNPVVSLVEAFWGRINRKTLLTYWIAQLLGGIAGVLITHAMYDQALLQVSLKDRSGTHFWISEFVATFGLICTVALAGKKHVEFAPLTVAAYIAAACWFTSSTAFVNPAVTIARMFTDTLCGISPASAPSFIVAQIAGAVFAFLILSLFRRSEEVSKA